MNRPATTSGLRSWFLLAVLSFIGLVAICNPSAAQTTHPSAEVAPPEKAQQLIELLDDPEVRAWLAGEALPSDPPAAVQIAGWEQRIRNHIGAMRNAVSHIPGEIAEAAQIVRVEINNRGFATIFVLFAAVLALGFGAEWLFRRAINGAHLAGRGQAATTGLSPESSRVDKSLSELAPLAVFSLVSAGVFLAFEWPDVLRLVILTYLVAFIIVRLVMAMSRILLAPDGEHVLTGPAKPRRLIQASDAEANFWYRRVAIFASYLMAGWATVSLLPTLGFSPDGRRLVAYLLGIGLLALAVEMVWRRPGRAARQRTSAKEWLLTIYLVILWGLWAAGLNGVLWLGIYALLLPTALTIAGQAAEAFAGRPDEAISANSVRTVIIVRGARALVILLAVLWLGMIWRLNPGAIAEGNTVLTEILRGLLQGVIILLVADLVWQLAKAYIGRKLETATVDGSVSPAEAARRGRLRTLLPIFRNMLGVFIAAVAILMVLSGLGVQIAPLIAGAGIFGVAIGFGSQTLVKDVISGVFYMLDDAFRVGEYIQSGSYKGTVESFSLRSVKLRHHRGPVFTVPFGSLGAVQNMSRDWVIDKFMIRVPFDTDIQQVKKLVKGIGAELKADPELAPEILETVKMKGVEEIGDFGIQLSFAFMAKPGHQSVVRRRAYTMIRQAFIENGIEFAQPTVQVGGDEKQAAAAATTTAMMRKKAAEGGAGRKDVA
ncbi:mechanosensitive ion channel family protein [Mesorhizobium sp. WSM2239]|uniref:Mechanosensitive ion channel family protein n=2 Tax=unclassified Mesorhizobium TaxID=325217 RepID=A0AAU8D8C7_9HYPH